MHDIGIMKNGESLQIEFVCESRGVLDRGWCGRTLDEPFARFYHIHSGSAVIRHHQETFRFVPGRTYLVPPAANMEFRCPRRCELIWLHFNVREKKSEDFFAAHRCRYVSSDRDTGTQMTELLDIVWKTDLGSRLRARGLFLQLLASFFEFQTDGTTAASQQVIDRLTPVLKYIETHLSETIPLDTLAELASYEKTYFSTLFKKVFSVSPSIYIREKRIEKARALLKNTTMTLNAVADDLGFSDVFHFSRVFKEVTGEPPSHFRRRQQQRLP